MSRARKIQVLLVGLLSIALLEQVFAQEDAFTVRTLTDPNILTKLFDSRTVVKGKHINRMLDKSSQKAMVVWKPNFYETFQFNVSYDGRCYTNLDTVMEYVSRKGKYIPNDDWKLDGVTVSYDQKYALLIFTTCGFEKLSILQDCHACSPDVSTALFAYDEGRKLWALEAFEKHLTKHGSWGRIDSMAIQQIGKEKHALELSSCYAAMGDVGCATTFYEPALWFKLIFSEKTHNSYAGGEGAFSPDYSWYKKIAFVAAPTESSYYDIMVSRTGRGHKIEDDYKSPIVDVSSTVRYTFDETVNRYVLVK